MPALGYTIATSFLVLLTAASILLGSAQLTGAQGMQAHAAAAEAATVSAKAWVEQSAQTYLSSHPGASLPAGVYPWTGPNGATATAQVEGDTVAGGAQQLAANLQTNPSVAEMRFAVDLKVTSGYPAATVAHRLTYRYFNGTVELLGDQDVGAVSDRAISAGHDSGGCAGSGAGCDSSQVQAADDQRVGAGLTCTQGVGSGACPGSGVFDKSTYSNQGWNNGQNAEGPRP